MKKLVLNFLTIITLCILLSNEFLAAPKYSLTATSGTYSAITGGTPFVWRVSGTSPNDEDYTASTPIGFPFSYDGVAVTEFQVSVNGFMKFSNATTGDTLLTTGSANNLKAFTRKVLAPLWDDIAVTASATDIDYQVTGSVGSRTLSVEWRNVKWNYTATSAYNFQVVLYEGTNNIEYWYGPQSGTLVSPSASIGLNDGTALATTVSTFTEATGTFLSIGLGGAAGSRVFHQSMGYEYFSLPAAPDPNTVLRFVPVTPALMSGAYSVPGSYPSLSEMAMALNINGISGPVTVNISAGTYDDIFHLINVAGTSATNTILVQPSGGAVTVSPRNGTAATVGPGTTTGDAMIRLDGTDFVTITGLNIVNNPLNITTAQKYDMGILLGNSIVTALSGQTVSGARFNTLKNLFIDMNALMSFGSLPYADSANGGAMGIRFGTNGPNGDTSQTNSYNTIQDVEIVDFWRAAIQMYGFSGLVPDVGNRITAVIGRNAFHNTIAYRYQSSLVDIRAIEINAQKDFLIEKTDIYDLQVKGLTTNGIYGIRMNPASGTDGISGNCTIRDINIYNFENLNGSTGAGDPYTTTVTSGFATGIETNNALPYTTLNVYKCNIYDLQTDGNTTCRTEGMLLNLGTAANGTINVYNNYVYDLRAPRGTTQPTVRGLDIQSAAGGVLSANIYYNTVYLDSSVAAAAAANYSACIYWGNFGTSILDLRNNILVNNMSAGTAQTGKATVLWPSAPSNLLRLSPTSNNNLFYSTSAPWANHPIVWDQTTSFSTLTAVQNAVATGGLGGPREVNSVYEFPPFLSSAAPYDLHLNTGVGTLAESGGLPISSVTTDWDGNARSTTLPDIGADEFAGTVAPDVVPPTIVYTQLGNTTSISDRTDLTATITDVSGVAAGSNLPRLYYKKGALGAWQFDSAPTVAGNNYSWVFSAAAMPGLAVGDTVFYYLAAQDVASTPNLATSPAGGSGVTPPGTTAPSTLRSYRIIGAPLSGTYTVGISAFNKLTGKNLQVSTITKKVVEKVRVQRNLSPIERIDDTPTILKDYSLLPGMDRAYSFDTLLYSPDEFEMKEVDKEFTVLMENGKIYQGPQSIVVTKEQLASIGVNTRGMENITAAYPTIAAAVADLNLRGVSGNVVLSLIDATYTEAGVEINSVTGVSSTKTITIKPASSTTVVWTNASAQIKVTNTSYVTIDGSNSGGTDRSFTINRSATAGNAVWFASLGTTPITNLTVKNCNIYTGEVTASSPVMISDAATSGNSGYFSNVTVQNNDLRKCRIAVYAIGGSTYPQNGSNLSYLDNSVGVNASGDSVKFIGLYVQGVNGVTIRNNDIGKFESITAETDRGIWLASGTINAVVERNKIHDLNSIALGQGTQGIYISSALANCNNIIRNNFIWNIYGRGSSTIGLNPYAIYAATNQTEIGIYNNSIYLTGELYSAASAANHSVGIVLSTGSFANIKNNAIHNNLGKSSTSASVWGSMGVYAFITPGQFTSLSNNVYYFNPQAGTIISYGHAGGSNGGPIAALGYGQPLSTWQANTGLDAGSLAGNPKFVNVSTGDLHVVTNTGTPCESGGDPSVPVSDDIDGNPRLSPPDIGADEFNGTKFMTINLKAIIDGFYNSGTNTMKPDIMKIVLRRWWDPSQFVDSVSAVLSATELLGPGEAAFNFRDPEKDSLYYIQVLHRNGLETWSATYPQFTGFSISYDFTDALNKAFGNNLVLRGSKYCIWSGDINQDGSIDALDRSACWNDRNLTGYFASDVNGDGTVDALDRSICWNNRNVIKQIPPGAGPIVLKPVQTDEIKDNVQIKSEN